MSRSRRKVFSLVVLTGLALGVLTACSKQAEGERCDSVVAGNSDCEDGLVCTRISTEVERCCPPEGARISDDRCNAASVPTAGTGGGVNTAGAGGSSGGTGGGSGGIEAGGTSGDGNTGGSEAGGTSAATAGVGGMSDAGESSVAGTGS
jgi:hypothetical protein